MTFVEKNAWMKLSYLSEVINLVRKTFTNVYGDLQTNRMWFINVQRLVMVGDVYISVLISHSIPGFSSTVWFADKYSCRKSSNSSSFISFFTDMSGCDGSVNPDISDFSSVLETETWSNYP